MHRLGRAHKYSRQPDFYGRSLVNLAEYIYYTANRFYLINPTLKRYFAACHLLPGRTVNSRRLIAPSTSTIQRRIFLRDVAFTLASNTDATFQRLFKSSWSIFKTPFSVSRTSHNVNKLSSKDNFELSSDFCLKFGFQSP